MDKKREEDLKKTKEALRDLGNRNTQVMKDYGSLGKWIGIFVIFAVLIGIIVFVITR